MEINHAKICRLCLKIVYNNSFECLEGNNVESLSNVLMLEVYTTKPLVVCKNCALNIRKSFNFKSMCICTENYIASFVTAGNYLHIDLRDLYMQKIEEADTSMDQNQMVCRFCLKLADKHGFMLLSDIGESILFHMLEVFMPEVNLNITKQPTICEECLESLQDYFFFIIRSLDVEDKINSCIVSHETEDGDQIMLKNVLRLILDPILSKMKIRRVEPNIATGDSSCLRTNHLNSDPDTDISSEKEIESVQTTKIKTEYFAENSDPDFEIQKAEKVLVIGDNIVVKAEVQYGLDDTNHIEFDSETSRNLIQTEIAMNDDKSREPSQADQESFSSIENEDFSSQQGVPQQEFEESNLESFQHDEGDRKPNRTKIKRSKPHAKLGRYSELISYKRNGISELAVYNCKVCGYESKYKHVAIRHSLLHKSPSEITMYRCEICSYKTKYKTYLKPHMLIHKNPSETVMYKCDICSHETKRKELLRRHMLSHKDPGEIPMYACKLCDFKGKQKSYLKRHSLVHMNSESQMYSCARCTFRTKHKQGLRRHMMTHKDPSEIIMYKCEVCPFRTKYRRQLNKHILTHRSTTNKTLQM